MVSGSWSLLPFIYLLYRGQDDRMTSGLGLAVSEEGLHFRKDPEPVSYPDNDVM